MRAVRKRSARGSLAPRTCTMWRSNSVAGPLRARGVGETQVRVHSANPVGVARMDGQPVDGVIARDLAGETACTPMEEWPRG